MGNTSVVQPPKARVFVKDGARHNIQMKQTGNTLPRPARIIIIKEYWDATGGWEGWDWTKIYDRTFNNWDYANAVYDEILSRADEEEIK